MLCNFEVRHAKCNKVARLNINPSDTELLCPNPCIHLSAGPSHKDFGTHPRKRIPAESDSLRI